MKWKINNAGLHVYQLEEGDKDFSAELRKNETNIIAMISKNQYRKSFKN